MSYDIWLTIDTGGPSPAMVGNDWNFTSNSAPAWRAAGANLADFDGRLAEACSDELALAILTMVLEPSKYRGFDPPNGWGTYDDLVPALRRLLETFLAHPKATVHVHR